MNIKTTINRTLGIDFGFSKNRSSFGYSQWETESVSHGRSVDYTIRIITDTLTTSLRKFEADVLHSETVNAANLITLDAPVTPVRIMERPVTGRAIDKRFSQSHFSNGKRGPQPSSIAVPAQGWALYESAMRFVCFLAEVGFPLFRIPSSSKASFGCRLEKYTVEVLPKLSMSLLVPIERVRGRPKGHSFYWQIDNWLFPHLFCSASHAPFAAGQQGISETGLDFASVQALLGDDTRLDKSVFAEANRIQAEENSEIRHEMIGAFVAGFQGSISFAGKTQLVGTDGEHEGYYLVPYRWNDEWMAVWQEPQKKRKQLPANVYFAPVLGVETA